MSFGAMEMMGTGSILTNIGSYITASKKAESDRKWQDYTNKMTRLINAQNQNSLTTNENMMHERQQVSRMNVAKSEYSTEASAEVAAAATGTVGRSVNMVLFDIARNAAGARSRIDRDENFQEAQIDNQRQQSEMQTAQQIDTRYIPDPNPATAMLGIASDMGKLWRLTK